MSGFKGFQIISKGMEILESTQNNNNSQKKKFQKSRAPFLQNNKAKNCLLRKSQNYISTQCCMKQ